MTAAAAGEAPAAAPAPAASAAAALSYAPPVVQWHADARALMVSCYGEAAFAQLAAVLATPPRATCVRVNTLRAAAADVRAALAELTGGAAAISSPDGLPEALLVHGGAAEARVDVAACEGRELAVDRRCAEAVLRGADVYVPGVLGCSAGVEEGMLVALTAVVEPLGASSAGMTRGTVLPPRAPGDTPRLLLGIGRTVLARGPMFRAMEGLAVKLVAGVCGPRLSGEALCARLPGAVMLQNLPSIVAARALAPHPGARVLDMCASPGGKTTALAALMGGVGEIVALDVSPGKVAQIRALCADLGVTIVSAHKMDATKAVQMPADARGDVAAAEAVTSDSGLARGAEKRAAKQARRDAGAAQRGGRGVAAAAAAAAVASEPRAQPFPPCSFDAILLDAPCSALGLRPRLTQPVAARELARFAAVQRALLHAAVALLRPGGALVFSTCTINPLENEANIGWLLATYPCMALAPHAPRLGSPGLQRAADGSREPWLTAEQAALVQRFVPGESDTIGFFVARFEKAR